MKKIAIIGATGMLGEPVAKAFINAGHEVSLLVRDVSKAKVMFGTSAKLIQGDVKDLDGLKKFLHGQEALYLNFSVEQSSSKEDFQAEREGLSHVLEAAKTAGIQRIGYLSSLLQFYTGLSWWVMDIKREALQHIKNSGIPYTIFYPSTFMESFGKGAYRQGNRINLAGTSHYKMYLIAGDDYGRQVVRAFALNDGNREFVIQGTEGFTADEAAEVFGKKCKSAKISVAKLPYGLLRFLGFFTNKFNYAAHIIYYLNNYPEKFEAEKTWEVLGKPEIRFEDYIQSL